MTYPFELFSGDRKKEKKKERKMEGKKVRPRLRSLWK
jgi:hypothetical protein